MTQEEFERKLAAMKAEKEKEKADIKDPGLKGYQVIDYNEPNAKFFHDLLISVCKLNEKIKDFVKEPEKMQAIINSSNKLLT